MSDDLLEEYDGMIYTIVRAEHRCAGMAHSRD
jgi:hypothetical protein